MLACVAWAAAALPCSAQFPSPISPTAMLSDDAAIDATEDSAVHLATDRRGRWMAVWSAAGPRAGASGLDADILVSTSDDDGQTWNEPVPLPGMNGDALQDLAPQVATDRRGTWIITWYANSPGDADVWVSRTTDNGQTFTVPAPIDPMMGVDVGDDFLPRIATDGAGVWLVAWQTCDPTGAGLGADEDIVFARSVNNGATWSAPGPLDGVAATDNASDVNVAMSTDGQGNWLAVWQSDRDLAGIGLDDDILLSRSIDNGASWSAPAALAPNAATDSGRDIAPAITNDGQCNWVVVWHSNENLGGINTDFDIFRSTSSDNGLTWSAVAPLNSGATSDNAPDFGACVATDHRGNWVATWTSLEAGGSLGSDSDVLVAHSANRGLTWSVATPLNDDAATDTGGDEAPVIVADRHGGWIGAWHAYLGMNGALGIDRDVLAASFFIDISALDPGPLTQPGPLSTLATTDNAGDFAPDIATDSEISWYATWSSTVELSPAVGSDEDIFFASSSDNGISWTSPIAVSNNALLDAGRDINPAIAFDGECVLVIAWASQSVPGTGTTGDYDIFFTRSFDHGLTWSPTQRLKTTGASDTGDDGLFDVTLATDGDGVWVCAWDSTDPLAGSGPDYDVMYAVSTDNGVTWATPRLLNSTASTDTLPDTFCRLAWGPGGRWIAVWDSFEPIGGSAMDRDIMYAVSDDDAQSWSTAAPIHGSALTDSADDLLPVVASSAPGQWMVVWQSFATLDGTIGGDADIVFVASTDDGATWSAAAPVNSNAPTDIGFDLEPHVAGDGTGNWVVAWASTTDLGGMLGTDYDLLQARSLDLGATWTAPVVLNADAGADVSFERSPRIAANGSGTWLAAWESSGDVASPFGADFDVLSATFALPPRCPGDTNGDQAADFEDLNRILELWAVTSSDPGWDPDADLSPNGAIDFGDLNAVLTAFGSYCD